MTRRLSGSSTTPIRTLCRRRLKASFRRSTGSKIYDHWDRLITWSARRTPVRHISNEAVKKRLAMRIMKTAAAAIVAVATLAIPPVFAEGTLRIGMTASDIPLTTGQTDNGGEGMRFMGYTVYDGLINWDLSSSADKPSDLVPGLATRWAADDSRQDQVDLQVAAGREIPRRHATSTPTSVVWNLDKLLNDKCAAIRPAPVGAGSRRASRGCELQSHRPATPSRSSTQGARRHAALPDRLDHDVVARRNGRSSAGSGTPSPSTPSGTGPWKLTMFVPRERAEMVPQQGVLGQGAGAEARQDGAGAAAGGECARRGAALRPGRLDRGAARPTLSPR